MMDDHEYIVRKFDYVAVEAATKIGKAIVKVQSQSALSGATGSSRAKRFVREALKEGFIEALRDMERVALPAIKAPSTHRFQTTPRCWQFWTKLSECFPT
jgi:nitrogenase subunit NifH